MDTQNNGTQAQAPLPTETEMASIRSMIDRALNAVVDASKLAETVKTITLELDSLKHEIGTVRDNNRWLDEQLSRVRKERDDVQAEAKANADKAHSLEMEVGRLTDSNNVQAKIIEDLRQQLAQAKKERDDYGLEAMQANESLTKAQAEVAKIKDIVQSLFPAKPEPKPEPVSEAHATQANPTPMPEAPGPVSEAKPKRIYEREPGFTWDKTTFWDNDRGLYYNEV